MECISSDEGDIQCHKGNKTTHQDFLADSAGDQNYNYINKTRENPKCGGGVAIGIDKNLTYRD